MELKTSTVKSVQGSGTWDSNYGTLYSFEYQMEDGTILKANHKTDSPFNVGEKVDYEITKENEFGKIGKVKKYNSDAHKAHATGNYPSKSKGSNASFALSYAKDLLVPSAGGFSDPNLLADDVLKIAERFNAWLNNN